MDKEKYKRIIDDFKKDLEERFEIEPMSLLTEYGKELCNNDYIIKVEKDRKGPETYSRIFTKLWKVLVTNIIFWANKQFRMMHEGKYAPSHYEMLYLEHMDDSCPDQKEYNRIINIMNAYVQRDIDFWWNHNIKYDNEEYIYSDKYPDAISVSGGPGTFIYAVINGIENVLYYLCLDPTKKNVDYWQNMCGKKDREWLKTLKFTK